MRKVLSFSQNTQRFKEIGPTEKRLKTHELGFLFYFGNVTLRYRRDAHKLPANRGDGKLVTTFYPCSSVCDLARSISSSSHSYHSGSDLDQYRLGVFLFGRPTSLYRKLSPECRHQRPDSITGALESSSDPWLIGIVAFTIASLMCNGSVSRSHCWLWCSFSGNERASRSLASLCG